MIPDPGHTHTPAVQLAPVGQTRPQVPQLLASDVVLMHVGTPETEHTTSGVGHA